ncbi:hypothetical protein MY11210_005787 [Beauveria gryllotalpidicola]
MPQINKVLADTASEVTLVGETVPGERKNSLKSLLCIKSHTSEKKPKKQKLLRSESNWEARAGE